MKKTLTSILCLAMLAGCSSNTHQETNTSATASATTETEKVTITNSVDFESYQVSMSDYEWLRGSAADFELITFKESIRMFSEKGSGILFFGYDTCYWCNRAVPELNEVAKELGVTIWYINAKIQPADEDYQEMLGYLGDDLSTDSEGEKSFLVPYMIGVKNGEIVGSHVALVDSFQATDDETQLTDSQKTELQNIYKDIIYKVAD